MHDVLVETEKRGMPFDVLLTIPEQDEWVYSDGKSTTCVAFILAMYKEAGIFGPISSSIQVTEFTVCLKILEHVSTHDLDLPFSIPFYLNNKFCFADSGCIYAEDFREQPNASPKLVQQ